MSDLESKAKAIISHLMHDLSLALDTAQQATISVWAVKTAMVLEATNRRSVCPWIAVRSQGLTERSDWREERRDATKPPSQFILVALFLKLIESRRPAPRRLVSKVPSQPYVRRYNKYGNGNRSFYDSHTNGPSRGHTHARGVDRNPARAFDD